MFVLQPRNGFGLSYCSEYFFVLTGKGQSFAGRTKSASHITVRRLNTIVLKRNLICAIGKSAWYRSLREGSLGCVSKCDARGKPRNDEWMILAMLWKGRGVFCFTTALLKG